MRHVHLRPPNDHTRIGIQGLARCACVGNGHIARMTAYDKDSILRNGIRAREESREMPPIRFRYGQAHAETQHDPMNMKGPILASTAVSTNRTTMKGINAALDRKTFAADNDRLLRVSSCGAIYRTTTQGRVVDLMPSMIRT